MLVVKSAKRVPKCINKGSTQKKTVVIGGGAGGFGTVEALRSYGYTGQIQLISRESYLPIDRPKLSKALKVDVNKIMLRDSAHFEDFGIEMTLDTVRIFTYLGFSKSQQSASKIKLFTLLPERRSSMIIS
jgi:malic enzyme